ncbi:MAG: cyclic nucleotide-binding domain-containing protein [Hyphomicrobium sp.]
MAMDALVKPLLRLPLFQGLKPLQLTEIVRRAGRIVYKPGDVLIEEDKLGDEAIIIISGEAARISGDGDSSPAETIVEGSMIAELAMLVETVHSATIVARTPIRALKISREDMHAQMADDPMLGEYMMSRIADRLKRLVVEIRAIDDALAALSDNERTLGGRAVPHLSGPMETAAFTSLH